MAFAANESTVKDIKKLYGICPVEIIAVNPNKKKLEEINPHKEYDSEPQYVTEKEGVKTARIDFWVKSSEKFGAKHAFKSKVTFFIKEEIFSTTDNTKVQVIDKYGRTCWISKEDFKSKTTPIYSNGPAKIDINSVKPVYKGEVELTTFIRTFLNVYKIDVYNKNTGTWGVYKDPSKCEGRIENVKNFFSNNFKEVEDCISLMPNNAVKVLFGIKTTENGQFMDVFNRHFMKTSESSTTALSKALNEAQTNGAYSSTTFHIGDMIEYVPETTNFGNAPEEKVEDNPFF